jgi:hypothetical protein
VSTPKGFGDRIHFEGDGCDDDSIRHRMGMQSIKLKQQVFGLGKCVQCGKPVMEEEFDCGNHGTN